MKSEQLKFQVKALIVFELLLLLLGSLNARADAEQAGALKDYLQNRLPISKAVFLVTDFTNGTISTSYLYEGGWNNEDFYLKRFAIRSDSVDSHSMSLTNFRSFWGSGKTGNKYWQMTASNDLTQTELQPQADPKSNPIAANALNSRMLLDQALNLGIRTLKTGTLRWNGDAFIGEFEDGMVQLKKVTVKQENGEEKTIDHPQIHGQAIRENGQIIGIKVSNFLPTIGPQYLLNYRYNPTNPLPKNVPNTILTERFVDKQKSEPVAGIEFLSIEFSDTNSPALAYSIGDYVNSTNSYNVVFSNDQYYTFNSNGSLHLLEFVGKSTGSSHKKLVVIGLMALSAAGLFLLLRFQVSSRKTTNQQ